MTDYVHYVVYTCKYIYDNHAHEIRFEYSHL